MAAPSPVPPTPVPAPVATRAAKPAPAAAHVTSRRPGTQRVHHRVVRRTLSQRVITEARKHYGTPYRWGATGPRSFDCSGFTGYVFRTVGVHLPRTSREQYSVTRHVSRSAKRVGDLIFTYSRGGRIHHVGIYAGASRMIAATHTGDVVRYERVRGRYKVGRVR